MVPRRNITSQLQPAELKIIEAIQAVESLGADLLLTDAVRLLSEAKDKVSDFIEQ